MEKTSIKRRSDRLSSMKIASKWAVTQIMEITNKTTNITLWKQQRWYNWGKQILKSNCGQNSSCNYMCRSIISNRKIPIQSLYTILWKIHAWESGKTVTKFLKTDDETQMLAKL